MKGTVTRSTGSWYDIKGEDGGKYKGRLLGKFKIKEFKVTNPIAVGDHVEFEQGKDESMIITNILPRNNYIIRRSVHKTSQGHLIASNIDQSILIATLAYPRTSLGFIDRFLISAEAFRIPAAIVFNKTDLYIDAMKEIVEELMEVYSSLGYTCLETSVKEHTGIEEFRKMLEGKISLLSGHSGVGKSSLLKAIAPELDIRISEISSFSNKGTHTTTFAEMFELGDNIQIIDSPGIKELGLFEIGHEELSHYFPEMRELLGQCKFHNCRHVNEPKCAVIEKVKSGEIYITRYESYLSILSEEDTHR